MRYTKDNGFQEPLTETFDEPGLFWECPGCGHSNEVEMEGEYFQKGYNGEEETFELECDNCDKEFSVDFTLNMKFDSEVYPISKGD